MPGRLAKLRFPKALEERLHHLLDEQGRKGKLTAEEKR
jgi:polyhydroxyalkanoate synthesis regulator phasin